MLTLLLLAAIAALVVSQFVIRRELGESRAEDDYIRHEFGHIRVEEPNKTYVARIMESRQDSRDAYRVRVSAGSNYMLHLTNELTRKPVQIAKLAYLTAQRIAWGSCEVINCE